MDRKIDIKVTLPWIVMDHVRDACEQVFPGARQQRGAPWHLAASRDLLCVAALDICGPLVGVAVGRRTQPAIVVSVKVVV